MNDLSKAREHLLQDYIKEFDPSQKEMDGIHAWSDMDDGLCDG